MKILITGSEGQLGLELKRQLTSYNIEFLALNRLQLDISNFDQVNRTILNLRPDVVINCGAYTKVEESETNEIEAFKVNGLGPKNIAIATEKINSKIIQISTDYVFDGKVNRPYREHDVPNPLNVYGKSKLVGENFVKEFNHKHFIIRTSWLYGEGNNFVKTILKTASKTNELSIVGDQIGTPTSTKDLTKAILNLIKTEQYGIYHGSCEGSCSWYEFAKRILEIKDIDIRVNKITTEELNRGAKRPKYSVLDNFMLKLMGLNTFRYWEDSLEEYLKSEVI